MKIKQGQKKISENALKINNNNPITLHQFRKSRIQFAGVSILARK